MGLDYKSSGVDIEAGYRSVELMKEHVKRTMARALIRNRRRGHKAQDRFSYE